MEEKDIKQNEIIEKQEPAVESISEPIKIEEEKEKMMNEEKIIKEGNHPTNEEKIIINNENFLEILEQLRKEVSQLKLELKKNNKESEIDSLKSKCNFIFGLSSEKLNSKIKNIINI